MSWWTPSVPSEPADHILWPLKRMLIAAAVALVTVMLVTVGIVIPAEDGADPIGTGALLGLDAFHAEPDSEPAPVPVANVTELHTYPYSWTITNELLVEESGELGEGESTVVDVSVAALNVTRIAAVLMWQDAATVGEPQPDTFSLSLDGPAGANQTTGNNDGESGRIATEVTATTTPADGNVTAASRDAATAMLFEMHGRSDVAAGSWVVTISLDDVADAVGDAGNAWTLQVFVETYTLVIGDATGRPINEATIPLSLEALGDWVEYKVFLSEGSVLEYNWTATGDVQYDMHGKRASGEETSHALGVSDGEQGELIIPFSGQHGWAMRNRGAVDVDVTIHIRGPFVLPA